MTRRRAPFITDYVKAPFLPQNQSAARQRDPACKHLSGKN
jgi:hypothetical protein